jgi:hypothetical protein
MIDSLKHNEVFVFGSNTGGKHGIGAARDAMNWGAEYGKNSGRQGQTYAIITKDLKKGFVGWKFIVEQLKELINYAESNDDLIFLLTPLATGLAGQTVDDLEYNIKDLVFPKNVVKVW